MQIWISWLLKKPTDLELHCLQRQCISGLSRTRVKYFLYGCFYPVNYGKCPKISNTLFHTFLAYILLFVCSYFLKYLMEWQTVYTLIRLLLWPGSALFAYAILSETLVYKITGHLSWIFLKRSFLCFQFFRCFMETLQQKRWEQPILPPSQPGAVVIF